MKVKDLVQLLQEGNQEAEVGQFDHFGRFLVLGCYDFCFRIIKMGDSPQGVVGSFLEVLPRDIGPEPE